MFQILGGAAAGAALMMLAPSLKTPMSEGLRFLLKSLIKAGCLTLDSGKQAIVESRRAIANTVEAIEDIAAEANAEIHQDQNAEPGAKKSAKKSARTNA